MGDRFKMTSVKIAKRGTSTSSSSPCGKGETKTIDKAKSSK